MYTVNDKELNPRETQIKRPVNSEELSLLLTTECYKYLRDKGEKFETYGHIISALLPNPVHAYDYEKPKNPEHLRKKIKYILEVYVARNRKNNYREIDTIGALELTKNEFIERMIKPFLNNRRIKNGDIFPNPREIDYVNDKITKNKTEIEGIIKENRDLKEKIADLITRMNNLVRIRNEREF